MPKRRVDDKAPATSATGGDEPSTSKGIEIPPPLKRAPVELQQIGPVSSEEEMEIKVLKIQNKNLAKLLDRRTQSEAELRVVIEQLRIQRTRDESVIVVMNRYWEQLDEDIHLLLQRYEGENPEVGAEGKSVADGKVASVVKAKVDVKTPNEAISSYLTRLLAFDRDQLDVHLADRVMKSKETLAKIFELDSSYFQRYVQATAQLEKLENLNVSLKEKFRGVSLENKKYSNNLESKQNKIVELMAQVEELKDSLQKVESQNAKCEDRLAETLEKLNKQNPDQWKIDGMASELEKAREFAKRRQAELDKLHIVYENARQEVEEFKVQARNPPEDVIVETAVYKALQAKMSVQHNEMLQLKSKLAQAENDLDENRNKLERLQHTESNIMSTQRKLRADLAQKEAKFQQLRETHSGLRNRVAELKAAKRALLKALKLQRKKVITLEKQVRQLERTIATARDVAQQGPSANVNRNKENAELDEVAQAAVEPKMVLADDEKKMPQNSSHDAEVPVLEKEKKEKQTPSDHLQSWSKKSLAEIKQLQQENRELLIQIAVQDPKGAVEKLNETINKIFDELRQEKAVLNLQLNESENGIIVLRAEHAKAIRELTQHLKARQEQVDTAELELSKVEARERTSLSMVETLKNTLSMQTRNFEMQKRKNIELVQSVADLKMHLELYQSRMKQAQESVAEKQVIMDAELSKKHSLQVEFDQFRQQVEAERAKPKASEAPDEVSLAAYRQCKETLTCSSCKAKPKDAVLTKCFHVFCYECLQARYDSRQRKCPECACGFGANDYHRLYL